MFGAFPFGQLLAGMMGDTAMTPPSAPIDPAAVLGPQVGQEVPGMQGIPGNPFGGGTFGGPLAAGAVGGPVVSPMTPQPEPGPAADIMPQGDFQGNPYMRGGPMERQGGRPNDPLAALRGVQAPPAPATQRLTSPAAPRPQAIQGPGLQQLMSLLFSGAGAGGGMKLPSTLGMALGGR
jgi:hypothetical protein